MRLAALPRFPLCQLPTPLQRAERLEAALGPGSPRIYLKRDDLTGLAFGGNKGRKLEYLVADALANGATTLITEGAAQSNHARMTAAAAVVAGLRCVLALDTRNGADLAGNLLLDRLFGADTRLVAGKGERRAAMAQIGDELRAAGEIPYLIPTGGSVPLGAAAYVAATLELARQLNDAGVVPRRLYVATGSQGTQSGLVVGQRALSQPYEVYGVAVEYPRDDLVASCVDLANGTADLLDLDARFDAGDVTIDDRFVGEAYGKPTPGGLEAIRLLARTEAVVLDPVYSGKAMAALIAHVRAGVFSPDDSVAFLHTGGGPSIFPFGETLLAG